MIESSATESKNKIKITCFYRINGKYGGSDGKESACNVGDPDSIPGSGRSPGEGNGNPLQYFCLDNNSTDRVAWQATVYGILRSWTQLRGGSVVFLKYKFI